MKTYIVTGHIIDFANENYNLFEPEIYATFKEANAAAQEMVVDEMSRYDNADDESKSKVTKLWQRVGDNGVDYDWEVNDHVCRLFEVKVRMIDVKEGSLLKRLLNKLLGE